MNEDTQENLKRLSNAILKKLIESDEIHEILRKLTINGEVNQETPLILVMELKQIKKVLEHKADELNNFVEGKSVTKGEHDFMDFYNEEFSDTEWLKQLKITLKDET